MRSVTLGAALVLGLALGCGRYGKPIRPEPKPAAPQAVEAEEPASPADEASELGEPDFQLNLPGIESDKDDD